MREDVERFVRREIKSYSHHRHPLEIAWTTEGTWVIPLVHLGIYTGLAETAGRFPTPDRWHISWHVLLLDTISIGSAFGWQATPPQAVFLRAAAGHIGDHDDRATTSFGDELEPDIIAIAHQVIEWLNEEIAPADRQFVLEDALYLISVPGSADDGSTSGPHHVEHS